MYNEILAVDTAFNNVPDHIEIQEIRIRTAPSHPALAVPTFAFLRHAETLIDNGYAVIPVSPLTKAPAIYAGIYTEPQIFRKFREVKDENHPRKRYRVPPEAWLGGPEFSNLWEWQKVKNESLQEGGKHFSNLQRWLQNERRATGGFTNAGVLHDAFFIAVDYDDTDPVRVAAFRRRLDDIPGASIERIGAKGFARYYRVIGNKGVVSRMLKSRRGYGLDILASGRQSVVAGRHPSGAEYRFTTPDTLLDTPIERLQTITAEDVEALVDEFLPVEERVSDEHDDSEKARANNEEMRAFLDGTLQFEKTVAGFNRLVNLTALTQLEGWVEDLPLFDLSGDRNGYSAVATWRESTTGRAQHERSANLSVSPRGIRDFGGKGYSPVQLVAAALEIEQQQAAEWLEQKLGLDIFEFFGLSELGAAIVGDLYIFPGGRGTKLLKDTTPEKRAEVYARREAEKAAELSAIRSGLLGIIGARAGQLRLTEQEEREKAADHLKFVEEQLAEREAARHAEHLYGGGNDVTIADAGDANDNAIRYFRDVAVEKNRELREEINSLRQTYTERLEERLRLGELISMHRTAINGMEIRSNNLWDQMHFQESADIDGQIEDRKAIIREASKSARAIDVELKTIKVSFEKALRSRKVYVHPAHTGTGKTRALGQHLLASTKVPTLVAASTNALVADITEHNPQVVPRYGQLATVKGLDMCLRKPEAQELSANGFRPRKLCHGCPHMNGYDGADRCAFMRNIAAASDSHHAAVSHASLFAPVGPELTSVAPTFEPRRAFPFEALVVDEAIEGSAIITHDAVWLSQLADIPVPVLCLDGAIFDKPLDEKGQTILAAAQSFNERLIDVFKYDATSKHGWHQSKQGGEMVDVAIGFDVGKVTAIEDWRNGLRLALGARRMFIKSVEGLSDTEMTEEAHGSLKKRIALNEICMAILEAIQSWWKAGRSPHVVIIRAGKGLKVKVVARKRIQSKLIGDKLPTVLHLNAFPLPDSVILDNFEAKVEGLPEIRMRKVAGVNRPVIVSTTRTVRGRVVHLETLKPDRAPNVKIIQVPDAPSSSGKLNLAGLTKEDLPLAADDAGDGSENRRRFWSFIRAKAAALMPVARERGIESIGEGHLLVVGHSAALAWVAKNAEAEGLGNVHTMTFASAVGVNTYENCSGAVIIGDGRAPPLEQKLYESAIAGAWRHHGSSVEETAWPACSGTTLRYVPSEIYEREIHDRQAYSRIMQSVERLRTCVPKAHQQEIFIFAGEPGLEPDEVISWRTLSAEIDRREREDRIAEILDGGPVSRNSEIMKLLRGDDSGENLTDWDIRVVNEQVEEQKVTTESTPYDQTKSLSYIYKGAGAAVTFCSVSVKRKCEKRFTTVSSFGSTEELEARCRALGLEIEGDIAAVVRGANVIPLSETALLASGIAGSVAEAAKTLRALKKAPPVGMVDMRVSWFGGGKPTTYLVSDGVTEPELRAAVEAQSGRLVKEIAIRSRVSEGG